MNKHIKIIHKQYVQVMTDIPEYVWLPCKYCHELLSVTPEIKQLLIDVCPRCNKEWVDNGKPGSDFVFKFSSENNIFPGFAPPCISPSLFSKNHFVT